MNRHMEYLAKAISDVRESINDGSVKPARPDYPVELALSKAGEMISQVKLFEVESLSSEGLLGDIGTEIRNMVLQGLDPVLHQCYFIPRPGAGVKLFRSIWGTIQVLKSQCPGICVRAMEIREGDVFKIDPAMVDGLPVKGSIIHAPRYYPEKGKIIGAYCVIVDQDGSILNYVHMDGKELKAAQTNQSRGGATSFQSSFEQEADKRTVMNRCLKSLVNTQAFFKDAAVQNAFSMTTDSEYEGQAEAASPARAKASPADALRDAVKGAGNPSPAAEAAASGPQEAEGAPAAKAGEEIPEELAAEPEEIPGWPGEAVPEADGGGFDIDGFLGAF